MNFHNTCIPDLRYTIPKETEQIIMQRIQAGQTQPQVAADFGITQPRVSQVEENISNMNFHNAYIPDLRYIIPGEHK